MILLVKSSFKKDEHIGSEAASATAPLSPITLSANNSKVRQRSEQIKLM